MGKIKRYRNGIERFLSGEKGQRFFNFAYSIGAAIVICGVLFKILYLPGSSILIMLGMGTEVVIFVLSAFDNPNRWQQPAPQTPIHDNEQEVIVIGQEKQHIVHHATQQTEQSDVNMPVNSEEMNVIYEKMLQTNSKYCEEAEKMTRNMEELNKVYSNMLNAMTGKN